MHSEEERAGCFTTCIYYVPKDCFYLSKQFGISSVSSLFAKVLGDEYPKWKRLKHVDQNIDQTAFVDI